MTCSVCIATYCRPDGLARLLESLFKQVLPPNCNVEIVVVDNDPLLSAEAVCQSLSLPPAFKLHYLQQPEKNISLTRNKAIHAATGDYLFLIDDDEVADPRWMVELYQAIEECQADVAFGTVQPLFQAGTPEWVRAADLFNRPTSPRGLPALATPTGNCVMRAAALVGEPGPFDPAYGTTGGEDSQLFGRLRLRHLSLISAPAARIEETIPPARTRSRWMLRRAYRTGNTATRIKLSFAPHRRAMSLSLALRACTFMAVSILLTMLTLPHKRSSMHWGTRIASNLGHLSALCGHQAHEYKRGVKRPKASDAAPAVGHIQPASQTMTDSGWPRH